MIHNNNATVSIIMVTYNHEKFIRAAIDGALMQETNFEYELIIANDCSPDKTDEIVNEYINTHPKGNRIRYYNHKKNLGMMPNFLFVLKQSKGKYIALCEGDDYWTDPYKLQKQVDILEANHSLVLSFHNIVTIFEGKEQEYREKNFKNVVDKKAFFSVYGNPIETASVMFRNIIPLEYCQSLSEKRIGDWYLYSYLLQYGNFGYIPNRMAAYRKHSSGMWTSMKYYDQLKVFAIYYYDASVVFKNEKEVLSNIKIQLYISSKEFILFCLKKLYLQDVLMTFIKYVKVKLY